MTESRERVPAHQLFPLSRRSARITFEKWLRYSKDRNPEWSDQIDLPQFNMLSDAILSMHASQYGGVEQLLDMIRNRDIVITSWISGHGIIKRMVFEDSESFGIPIPTVEQGDIIEGSKRVPSYISLKGIPTASNEILEHTMNLLIKDANDVTNDAGFSLIIRLLEEYLSKSGLNEDDRKIYISSFISGALYSYFPIRVAWEREYGKK
jgi:hypothetical protein